jgi:hypothetical protein
MEPYVTPPSSHELTLEIEYYIPSMDRNGDYSDKIIPTTDLRCRCGSRKDKVYSHDAFVNHTKTKHHQHWLYCLNLNKVNYYAETETLQKTLQSQQKIIAQMDKEIQNKNMTIYYLTEQMNQLRYSNVTTSDLLDLS